MVRLTTLQHRISRCQVATQSPNGLSMPFTLANSPVKCHHMAAGHAALVNNDSIGCFGKPPFKVMIDIRSGFTVVRLAARRLYSGHCAAIAGQVRTIGKTCYVPNLQGNEDRQYRSYAGYGHQQLHLRGYLYDLPDALLSRANLPLQLVKKFQTALSSSSWSLVAILPDARQ